MQNSIRKRGAFHGVTRIGVAGWEYPDWKGTVYPQDAGKGFDRLAFLSDFVDAIEINSTFYRPCSPQTAASWVRRTRRPGFRFTAKAHRAWTHESEPPGETAIAATLAGLDPLREADLLGALLVQFPQSFHLSAAALARLDPLLDRLEGWPVVIEVRHVSWEDDRAAAWAHRRGAGWCVVDQPLVGRSTARPLPRVTSHLAYLRLHGRNAATWFNEGAGRDARYDYRYGPEEIDEIATTSQALSRQADEVYVIANNHFRGKALVMALELMRRLRGTSPPSPESLVRAYPDLASSVTVRSRRLL